MCWRRPRWWPDRGRWVVLNQGPLEQVPVAVEKVATWDGRVAARGLTALVVVAGTGQEDGAESGVWREQGLPLAASQCSPTSGPTFTNATRRNPPKARCFGLAITAAPEVVAKLSIIFVVAKLSTPRPLVA